MGDKTFHWQYPGEEENRILNATSYDISDSAPQYGTELAKQYRITGKAVVIEDVPPPRYPGEKLVKKNDVIEVYLLGTWMGGIYDWRLYPNGNNMNSKLTYVAVRACNIYSCECYKTETEQAVFTRAVGGQNRRCKTDSSSYYEPGIYSDSLHDIQAVYEKDSSRLCRTQPVNKCEFRIFGNNQHLAYYQEEEVCPQVWEPKPKKCPPGTCAVNCHGITCCYNSQGIAVDLFRE